MHKSKTTAVFLAAILLAGVINVASPMFIINDAIAGSDEKEKKYNYNMHEKNANNEYDLYDDGYDNYKQNYKDGDSGINSDNEDLKNGHVTNKFQIEEDPYNIDSYSNNRDSEDKDKSYEDEKEYKDDYKKDDMREYDKYKEKEYKKEYKDDYKKDDMREYDKYKEKEYKDDYKKDDMREYDKYKEKLSKNGPNLYDPNQEKYDNYEKVYNEFSTNIDEIKLDKSTNEQDDAVTTETGFSQKQKQNDFVSEDIHLKTDDKKIQKENLLRSNIASNIDSNNNQKIRTNLADEDPIKLCDDCYLFYMDFLTRDEITIAYTELINTLNEKGANLDQLNTQNEIPLLDSANLWEMCEALAKLLSSDDKSSALSGLLISWANNIEENIANYEGTPRNVYGENIGLVILAIINCIADQNNIVLQVEANGLEQAPPENSLQKQEQPVKQLQEKLQQQQKQEQNQLNVAGIDTQNAKKDSNSLDILSITPSLPNLIPTFK
ncbi:MAG TPA: hypothetical protein VJ767_11620 [Nitrososphaeraceae archaeon]|nr:hypothetical protein [Nitrososphaeraceae archaeon]